MTIDAANVVVLVLAEACVFCAGFLHARAIRQLRAAQEFKKASAEYKASGERAYNDAREILRQWEKQSGQIVPGLIREQPPETGQAN